MNTSSMFDPTSSHSVDEVPAPQFAIAVSATLQQRRTRTLKHGDTFAVFDHRGDIGGEPGNPEGLYHRDTRMLSQLQLLLEEAPPLLLSSMTQDDNAVFTADLSNPDLLEHGQIALRRENIHLNRMKFIWNGACYERLVVRNFSDRPLDLAFDVPLRGRLRRPFRGAGRTPKRTRRMSRRAQERSRRLRSATRVSMRSSGSRDRVLSGAEDADHGQSGLRNIAEAPGDAQNIRARRLQRDGTGRMDAAVRSTGRCAPPVMPSRSRALAPQASTARTPSTTKWSGAPSRTCTC